MKRCQVLRLGLHEAADLGRRAPEQPLIPGQGVDEVRFGEHDTFGLNQIGCRGDIGPVEAFGKGVEDLGIAELTILAAALTEAGLRQASVRVGKRGVIEHLGGQHAGAQIAEALKKGAMRCMAGLETPPAREPDVSWESPSLLDTPGRAARQ